MGYQYKGYCYETQTDVANAFTAENIYPISAGLVFTNTSGFIGNNVNFTLQYKTGTTTAAATNVGTLTKYFPSCTSIGPITTVTNMSVSDAIELSWLVVMVFVAAFSFKQMRRSL